MKSRRPPGLLFFRIHQRLPMPFKILCPAGHQRAQKIQRIFDGPYQTLFPPFLSLSFYARGTHVGGFLGLVLCTYRLVNNKKLVVFQITSQLLIILLRH